ncbi:ARM repeat-containing protein [Jaminaea rosea]|uniref:Importin-95 n=1 Tax=Jaminaea rosea TaxID=1569628 RepID=A0A316UN14_9BASI|nr:ARM repeat-containing protein [Jaminaea rosea]PWN26198.1 ARM repeat-containing protein [Jaminaea rosea]
MNAAEVLSNTLSPDASVRAAAEKSLEDASRDNFPAYMDMLANEMANDATQVTLRVAAALAVKNALTARESFRQDEFSQRWLGLPEDARNNTKSKALSTLGTANEGVGRNSAQLVAAIAAIELPVGGWKELIGQLLGAIRDQTNERLRQSALQAIGFVCETVKSNVLTAQSNEILTAVVHGARKEEPSPAVQLAAIQALLNSLEFVAENFEREGERNYIMQVVCEATQSSDVNVKVSAYECLVKIMQLYYHQMRYYMEQALFGLTVLGMRDPEQRVALQAVEFWSTVCEEEIELAIEAAEYTEFGEEPYRQCYNFARIALGEISPVLMDLLKVQDENDDEDDWNVAKAAGTCIGLLANCVQDDIVPIAIPFIEQNIKSADWQSRDAAVLCFGSVLDGPDATKLTPLVEQALPTVITMLQDSSVAVKDSAAWTLGRITDLLAKTISTETHLNSLVSALVTSLQDEARISCNCSWALTRLVSEFGGRSIIAEEQANPPERADDGFLQAAPISPFFEGITTALLQIASRPTNESNSRSAAFEAIGAAVDQAPRDCLTHVSNIVLQLLERQEGLNGMADQLVGMDDINNWVEMQASISGVVSAALRRLGKEILPLGDRIMTNLLTLIQHGTKLPAVLEDAFLAVGSVVQAFEGDFEKYLDAFLPFLVSAIGNHEATQLCSVAVGVVGDLSNGLGEGIAKHAQQLMTALFEGLQSSTIHRDVKPTILRTFGDVALATGAQFEPYLGTTMAVLGQAGSTTAPQDDYAMIDYVNYLREAVAEAFVGVVAGLKSGNRTDLLQPYVELMLGFLSYVSQYNVERTEALLRASLGLLGDVASTFPGGQLKGALEQPAMAELIKAGRSRSCEIETRKLAAYAREEVKKATVAAA